MRERRREEALEQSKKIMNEIEFQRLTKQNKLDKNYQKFVEEKQLKRKIKQQQTRYSQSPDRDSKLEIEKKFHHSKEEEQRIKDALDRYNYKMQRVEQKQQQIHNEIKNKLLSHSEKIKLTMAKVKENSFEKEYEVLSRTYAKLKNGSRNKNRILMSRSMFRADKEEYYESPEQKHMKVKKKLDFISEQEQKRKEELLKKSKEKDRIMQDFKASLNEEIQLKREIQNLHKNDIKENIVREQNTTKLMKEQLIQKIQYKSQKVSEYKQLLTASKNSRNNKTLNATFCYTSPTIYN